MTLKFGTAIDNYMLFAMSEGFVAIFTIGDVMRRYLDCTWQKINKNRFKTKILLTKKIERNPSDIA